MTEQEPEFDKDENENEDENDKQEFSTYDRYPAPSRGETGAGILLRNTVR